jgi:glycosyltransferase involved in cell wall biosynthesis
MHVLLTRIFDKHGFGSVRATKKFINQIVEIDPDVIHLHNLHGYYINIEILFEYLKNAGKPIVWTLHDCWPFTGHCSHYDFVGCDFWKSVCHECPNKSAYPSSWLIDNSTENFYRKKAIFTGVDNLVLVSPSEWLAIELKSSFLRDYKAVVIPNGVNRNLFKQAGDNDQVTEKNCLLNKRVVLGVASFWGRHKGLDDFIKLGKLIAKNVVILLIGLNENQQRTLPVNIIGLSRTENVEELVSFYSVADVFVNPTYVDTFPTTNLEALACGTPVVTYKTGGSPEAIDAQTGIVVEKGDVQGLAAAIGEVLSKGKRHYSGRCRERAEKYFDKDKQYLKYLKIYEELVPGIDLT